MRNNEPLNISINGKRCGRIIMVFFLGDNLRKKKTIPNVGENGNSTLHISVTLGCPKARSIVVRFVFIFINLNGLL